MKKSTDIKKEGEEGAQDGEEVIFDADRDNNGKGVSPDEIIRMLKKNYKA